MNSCTFVKNETFKYLWIYINCRSVQQYWMFVNDWLLQVIIKCYRPILPLMNSPQQFVDVAFSSVTVYTYIYKGYMMSCLLTVQRVVIDTLQNAVLTSGHMILNSPLECPSSCPPSPHCLYGLSGCRNSLCTPCSSYSHHIPEWLCTLNTSSRPPEWNRHFSTWKAISNKCFWFAAAYVSTGPTVMSPARQGIKGLFAPHAHGHLIVSNPARSSFTQFWYLEILHRNTDKCKQ